MMKNLAIVLESIGIIGVVTGITIEAILHADVGFVVITVSSVIIASGGLIWIKHS